MDNLGKSIDRLKNGGAKLGFWSLAAVILFLIGFVFFVELDSLGKTMFYVGLIFFVFLAIYMYFKAKTEVHLKEYGIYVRNVSKKHEILYDEIAKLDKTKRVGKSGSVIIVFYLLVIEKKDGERITLPFRIPEDFLMKFIEVSCIAK